MSNVRKLITDALLILLSGLLIADFTSWLARALGWSTYVFTEDAFVAHGTESTLVLTFGFGLALVIAFGLDRARVVTLGRVLFTPSSPGGRGWRWHLGVVFGLILFLSLRTTEASLRELLDPDGLAGAVRLWSGLTHPNFDVLGKTIALALQTVLIAFLATVLAVPFAGVLSFAAAQNLASRRSLRALYYLVRFGLNVARSIEPLIWALIFTVWVGVGPFAGMLALLVHAIASLTKYYSEIIEAVDDGPLEAIRSTGARPFQVIWYAVVPQVILPFIAMTIYRWDTNVRMATVIGLVGGGGIGTLLIQYQGQAMWPEVGCIVLVIAVIVWALDLISAHLRDALK